MRGPKRSLLYVALCLLGPQTHGAEITLFDFESRTGRWHAVDVAGKVSALQTALTPGQPRNRALKVDVAFPREAEIRVKTKPGTRVDWTHYDELRFRVFVPAKGPYDAQAVVYIKDGELRWYQTLVEAPLKRGEWTTVRIDISDQSQQWSFQNHYRPWDGYTKQQIAQLGIKFLSRRTYVGSVFVDDLSVASVARLPQERQSPPHLFDFRTNTSTVPRYGKFEITFELSRTYANPFDPKHVDVRGRFLSPSGVVTVVPGFFYQDYIRGQERRMEKLRARGRSKWKIRFAPTETGTYRYVVAVNDADPFETRMREFEAVPSDDPGYVRISKSDPNYFEFDNGDFFYPIGHNVCATFDARNAENLEVAVVEREGTYAYERYFKRMAENGENAARIWFAAWAFSIEWTKDYDIHFDGLGRYNLENAWRLDYILDLAEKYGIYVMFTFTPHGEMQPDDSDHAESDWGYSPYNVKNGGFLRTPENFWTHPEARRYYQQKVRYILARWAYSPNVFAWEIFNEVDLAKYYRRTRASIGAEWTGRMAGFIKENDPAKHIVTTNLFFLRAMTASAKQWTDPVWTRPEIDISTGHIFVGDLPRYLRVNLRDMATHNKIFYVTECGDTPFGQGPQQTEAYLHLGIWASHVMPYAGVAMPWWWIFIDDRNLYPHFKALAKFAEGEDRRGRGIDFKTAQVLNTTSRSPFARYRVEACGNKTWAAAWVYDQTHFGLISDETQLDPKKTALVLADFATGTYKAEIWDTYKGEIVETRTLRCTGDHLVITPLKVEKDVAIKIKRVARKAILPAAGK